LGRRIRRIHSPKNTGLAPGLYDANRSAILISQAWPNRAIAWP
jgi:hypothetical protein